MRLVYFILLCSALSASGQGVVRGKVFSENLQEPLIGAFVYWDSTNVAAFTDVDGFFEIKESAQSKVLVASFTGFTTRKFIITNQDSLFILLKQSVSEVDVVEIKVERPATSIDMISAIKIETINEAELKKAACCNLSESFETNPTVDVVFTDAVTGTKQIQMLGLAGPYALITAENIPALTGNAAITGLNFVPGQWLRGIQLIKGAGSVVNGYQSIAGQINLSYKDLSDEKLFVNFYANAGSNTEANIIVPYQIKHKHKAQFFVQADNGWEPMDRNGDGFMDNRIGSKLVLMNTLDFNLDSSNWDLRTGLKVSYLDKEGGELLTTNNRYKFENNQQKIEAWAKLGYVFDAPGRSTGLQLMASTNQNDLLFGKRRLLADENQLYLNWIYADILANSNHKIKTGASFVFNALNNNFDGLGYGWDEGVVGVFGEYTYKPNQKFSLVTGVRGDYSSVFGYFVTPRLHGRYEVNEQNVIRFSGGMGTKNPNPFLESFGVFASSRSVVLGELQQEKAVNTGANYTKKFIVKNKPFTFSADYYYTYFMNKVLADYDVNSTEIHFYNLKNSSVAHSFMTQILGKPLKDVNFSVAYRWYQVQSMFNGGGFINNPFSSVHRAFGNLGYALGPKWRFDYTLTWNGRARIPELSEHPEELQANTTMAQSFFVSNSQVNYEPNKRWEFYVGAENLFNYQQPNPIVDANDPFSEFFDASMIWAPVFGRNIYAGIRFIVNK